MNDKRIPQSNMQCINENIASIQSVDTLAIHADDQEYFIQRASEGEDVYAYCILPPREGATMAWNIWDTDVRIPYSDQPITWSLAFYCRETPNIYKLSLRNLHTPDQPSVLVLRHYPVSIRAAMRHIRAYIQHLNVFGGEPTSNITD